MLLRLIPPSPQPTVLYTLGFAQSLPLPLPRAWSAQHQLLTSVLALPAPVSIHALDRSASLVALAHDVSLDITAREVRVTFVDGRIVTLPMEDGLVRMLDSVMADVRRSSGDTCGDADTNEEECSTRSSSPSASPLAIFKKHRRQRSLLLSLISTVIPRVILGPPTRPSTPQYPTAPTTPTLPSTPSSPLNPAMLAPRASDSDSSLDPSALRRRARSTLVDAWRRYVQSAIISGLSEGRASLAPFPNAGYIEWVVRGRMDEVLIEMSQLRTEGRRFWLEQRSREDASVGREHAAPPRLVTSASPVDIANKKRSKSVRVEETKIPPRERARAKSRNRIPSPFPRDAESDDWGIRDGRSSSEDARAKQSPSPPLTSPDGMADLLTYDFELDLPATGDPDDFNRDDYKLEVGDPFRLQRSSPRDARRQKLKQRWEIGYSGDCVCLCAEEGACGLVCEDDRECRCGHEDASTSRADKRSSLNSSESETSVKTPPEEGEGGPIPLPLPTHLAKAKKVLRRSFSKPGTSSSSRTPAKACKVKLPTHLATRYSMLTGQLSSLRNALIVIRVRADEEAWQIIRSSAIAKHDPLCGECARRRPAKRTSDPSPVIMTPALIDLEERARRRAWSNGIAIDTYTIAHQAVGGRVVPKEPDAPKPPPGLDACQPPSYAEAIAFSPPSMRPIQPRGIEMSVPIASSPLTCYMWSAEDLAAEGYTLDQDDAEGDEIDDNGNHFVVGDVAIKRDRKSLRRTSSRPQLLTVCEESISDTECGFPSSEDRTCSSPDREPEIGATFATTAMEFPHDAFDEDDLESGGYVDSSADPAHSSPHRVTESGHEEARDDGPFSGHTSSQDSTSTRVHGGLSTPDLASLSSPILPIYRPTPITPKSADELPSCLDASALLFQPLSQFASASTSAVDDEAVPVRRVPSTLSTGRRNRIHSLPIALKPPSNAHDLSREYALPPPECSSDDPVTALTSEIAPAPAFPYAHMQVHHKKDGQDRHSRSEEAFLIANSDDFSLGLDVALARAEEGLAEG